MCGDSIVSITYGRTAQKKGKRYLVSFNVVDTRKKKRGKGKTHFFGYKKELLKPQASRDYSQHQQQQQHKRIIVPNSPNSLSLQSIQIPFLDECTLKESGLISHTACLLN